MKKLLLLLLILIAIFLLFSVYKFLNREDINIARIFVDSETNIMYVFYKSGYSAGMSVMLNKDGLSKILLLKKGVFLNG